MSGDAAAAEQEREVGIQWEKNGTDPMINVRLEVAETLHVSIGQ